MSNYWPLEDLVDDNDYPEIKYHNSWVKASLKSDLTYELSKSLEFNPLNVKCTFKSLSGILERIEEALSLSSWYLEPF